MNTQIQQVYKIHQHHLSNEGQITLECRGWEAAKDDLEIESYVNKGRGAKGFKPEFWQFYKPAVKVAADSLEQVFHAGNGYGEFAETVEKLGPAYSCSVGDIIQCGGLYWMVDPCGFTEVTDQVKAGTIPPTPPTMADVDPFFNIDHNCTASESGTCKCGAWMDPAGTVHQADEDPAAAYE